MGLHSGGKDKMKENKLVFFFIQPYVDVVIQKGKESKSCSFPVSMSITVYIMHYVANCFDLHWSGVQSY